jgi:hypothetical protein
MGVTYKIIPYVFAELKRFADYDTTGALGKAKKNNAR